ncbi:MAG: hypothetical protein HY819_18100 [Acidobacteria bacterium]|nr:hypothetical protein [Acidobacteriota bacterium]
MKSSSASLFGVIVAMLSVVSAVLLVTSENYGTAILAIALGGGTAVLLFTAQNIVGQLDDLRHDIETLRNSSNSSSSNLSLENSITELKTEINKLNRPSDLAISLPAPNSQIPSNIGAPTTALSPTSNQSAFSTPDVIAVPPIKKESYQPLSGLSLSSAQALGASQQNLNQSQNLSSKFPAPSDDPNRTNASFATAKSPVTSPNSAVSNTGSHDSMETTQSFLPHVPSGHAERFQNESNSTNLSTEATIGFESSSLPPAPVEISNSYKEIPKTPSKIHSKIKKRYSTFAGLSLNEDSPEANKYKEDLLTPPPPPPPPSKVEKKRYSTFAGLALGERSRISPPSSPSPSNIASSVPPIASQKPGNPLSILSPSTVTNLGFSKNTDGTGVSREELIQSEAQINQANVAAPQISPSPLTKGTRKRYQTFMGLSLSKTPQPLKRYEEPPMEATAPLSVASAGSSYSKAPAPSSLQAAINRGQQGNLVDGFCSLCGSPQAAANDYATTGSEPEFCWYCGAKLR